MKVVILCGGKGTRLGLTDKPKPMVPVAGRPLLERLVETAKASGFREFVFLNGHLGHVIESHFGDGSAFGVTIEHVQERDALGTAGALRDAKALLTEPFIVLYGDILIDVDLAHFARFHAGHGGIGSLFVHPNDHPHDSDLVEIAADQRIVRFLSKPHLPGSTLPNLVSGALYVLNPAAIDYVPAEGSSDWGHDVFPAIISGGGALFAYRSLEYAKDIGTPDRLARGEADMASGKLARLSRRQPKPALFLDRDGVLNVEKNGIHRPEMLKTIEGVGAALRRANRAGLPAIAVTNQPDIAKGFMTADDLARVHDALDTRLAQDGAYLDDLYFCPHHPEGGFVGEVAALKIECDCRKPAPGMLLKAAQDHNLDLSRSFLVGDRYADMAAARAAGVGAILVRTGHAGNDAGRYDCEPDHIVADLPAAIDLILGETA
jgi:mannose-1-phosphate guanylyltransferase/phosphomannomutase